MPTLEFHAASGVQSGGNTLFANNISNVSTGVTLIVNARVNSSGIVTMLINQQVSAPAPPASSQHSSTFFESQLSRRRSPCRMAIPSPLAGSSRKAPPNRRGGIPFLQRIPILGAAFGAKTSTTSRTELIVFFTPHVIYDTASLADATDDLRGRLKHLKKEMAEQ